MLMNEWSSNISYVNVTHFNQTITFLKSQMFLLDTINVLFVDIIRTFYCSQTFENDL